MELSETVNAESELLAKSSCELTIGFNLDTVRYEIRLPVYELTKMSVIRSQMAIKIRRDNFL